jgi:hypothetical protein
MTLMWVRNQPTPIKFGFRPRNELNLGPVWLLSRKKGRVAMAVCTENLIRVDDVMESLKLAE